MHAIAMVAILISITSLNAAPLPFSAAVKACAREDLQAAVDGYLDAMRKGTPSSMPMASTMKYMENRRELPLGQGIWKTPLDINFSRSLLDTETCESYTEIIHASSLHPYVI